LPLAGAFMLWPFPFFLTFSEFINRLHWFNSGLHDQVVLALAIFNGVRILHTIYSMEDIIIIGAGPAGLMTAYELSKSGKKCLILEARCYAGGRVYSHLSSTGNLIETGAEFIHGMQSQTLDLLKEGGLSFTETAGEWIHIQSGIQQVNRDSDLWDQMLTKLGNLDSDMTLQQFLEQYYPSPEFTVLKDRAIAFAEGFDAADASRISCKALYLEWNKEHEPQFRIDKGYSALIDYLLQQCLEAGHQILYNQVVSQIEIGEADVKIHGQANTFQAKQLIVALPLGVLQDTKSLQILPANPLWEAAIQQLGMGDVIKVVLEFRSLFWEDQYPDLGFLLSGADFPTWWTQSPHKQAILTGWMAGRTAQRHAGLNDDLLLELAMKSLAELFEQDQQVLKGLLLEAHIYNWSADPYTKGAYAYATVRAEDAIAQLKEPLSGMVFHAGEYMYYGPAMGTVEAALLSGVQTAADVLSNRK